MAQGASSQCRQTQTAVTLGLVIGGQDRAVFIEAGEAAGQFVQIVTQRMRRAFTGDVLQQAAELGQMGGQVDFGLVLQP